MIIKNLATISLTDITKTFNEAFADYVIQFTASEEYLQNMWKAAGVDYNLSFGSFSNENLVGFIIHGIDQWNGRKTAFNIGTGVVPEYRGRKIVKMLYDYAIPILKDHGIEQCLLEVIQENEKSIKAYRSVGFKEERELIGFTYNLEIKILEARIDDQLQVKVDIITNIDWDIVQSFWDFKPSWEHSISTVMRSEIYRFAGLYKKERLIGYAIFNPKTGYISQFAITKKERGKGYAKCLFQKLTSVSKKLAVINVDKRSKQTMDFLTAFGFKEFVKQYEMKKFPL